MSAAPTSRMSEAFEGNPCTTRVRRLISRLARSWPFVGAYLHTVRGGKVKVGQRGGFGLQKDAGGVAGRFHDLLSRPPIAGARYQRAFLGKRRLEDLAGLLLVAFLVDIG